MFTFAFSAIVMAIISHLPVSAHSLTTWAEHYTPEKAGKAYHFAINDRYHIDGNVVRYFWADKETETLFLDALYRGCSKWHGLISVLEMSSPEESHMKIAYDPDPTNNISYVQGLTGGDNHYHYGGDYSDISSDLEGKWYSKWF